MKASPSQALIKEYQNEIREAKKAVAKISLNADADEDYEASRALLQRLIVKAEDALDPLLNLSVDSESPRAFEVLCNLLKTISELAESLINLQKTRHTINMLDNPDQEQLNSTTNNTAVFIGSTDVLQRYLKSQKEVIDV